MSKTNKQLQEEKLAQFAQENESINEDVRVDQYSGIPEDRIKEEMRAMAKKGVAKQIANQKTTQNLSGDELARVQDQAGLIPIPLDLLPTEGKFYPVTLQLYIRAAKISEIRDWSMLNEENMVEIDTAMNKILRKCVTCHIDESIDSDKVIPFRGAFNWKDLKEVDRFYLLLAIRDLTFIEGDNGLKLDLNEHESIDLNKDMLQSLDFDKSVEKFYSAEERCFVFTSKKHLEKPVRIYIPSLGVNQWIRDYVLAKSNAKLGFDQNFILIAPFIIKDYRGLTPEIYEDIVKRHSKLSAFELSLISQVVDLIKGSVRPYIKYIDEAGGEQTAPLSFRGGFKSLFLLQDTLSLLD